MVESDRRGVDSGILDILSWIAGFYGVMNSSTVLMKTDLHKQGNPTLVAFTIIVSNHWH